MNVDTLRREDGQIDGRTVNTGCVQTPVSVADCRAMRQAVVDGAALDAVAERHDVHVSSVREHLRGDCPHETDTPALQHGYYLPVNVSGAPDRRQAAPVAEPSRCGRHTRGRAVSTATCAAIRRWLVKTDDTSAVGERFGIAARSAGRHARGKCSCEPGVPPLARGWHLPLPEGEQ